MITNLLPLETFRALIGYHPWHFWGWENSSIRPSSSCNDVVTQYAWQAADAAGRADIQQAIISAESKMMGEVNYAPAPRFGEVTLPYPAYMSPSLNWMSAAQADGKWMSVQLPEKQIRGIGVELLTLLETVTLTYSDTDNDGIADTFTATTTATTTRTDPNEIAAYFASGDRLDNDGVSDRWRVLPLKVTINANGTVTIRGRAWILGKPVLYESPTLNDNPLDPSTATNFVTTLEVYTRVVSTQGTTITNSQAKLIWETFPFPAWQSCCGGTLNPFSTNATDPAAEAYAIARAVIRNAEAGLIGVGEAAYDTTAQVWKAVNWSVCKPPDRITIRFYAGVPLVDQKMEVGMATMIARFACAEMPRRICACETANRELYRWQFDMGVAGANDERYTTPEDLNNPFGTRRGQIEAWRTLKGLQLPTAIQF